MLKKLPTTNLPRIIKLFILMVTITIVAILLIEIYCIIFGKLSLMAKDRFINNPIIALTTTPILFWLSAFLCRKYSPESAGNSMKNVKDSMKVVEHKPVDYHKLFTYLNLKVIIIKPISSFLAIFAGGALGREGPAVHISTAFFMVMRNKCRSFLPKMNPETWVFTGSAIGLTVAFHAPISGMVFVLEKLIKLKSYKYGSFSNWAKRRLIKAQSPNFFSTILWSAIAIIIYKLISHPKQMFIPDPFSLSIPNSEILTIIAISIICGTIALAFKKTQNHLFLKVTNIKSKWWHLIPISAGIIVAILNLEIGIYSFGGGIFTTNTLLTTPEASLSIAEVGARMLNTIITFAAGCAGGLIAPAVAIGSGIGSLFINIASSIDSNLLILIGMTAFLSAILDEPITAAIIVFEITGQSIDIIPLLSCVSLMSLYSLQIAKALTHKIYNRRLHREDHAENLI